MKYLGFSLISILFCKLFLELVFETVLLLSVFFPKFGYFSLLLVKFIKFWKFWIFHGLTIFIKKRLSFFFFKFRCYNQVNYYNSQLTLNILELHLSSSAFTLLGGSTFFQIIIIVFNLSTFNIETREFVYSYSLFNQVYKYSCFIIIITTIMYNNVT